MKLTIDREADALYLSLNEITAVESEEVAPGIVVDYDAENRVVGIEMLHLSKRAPGADTRRLLFETIEAETHV
ncbi:DUF2283 domain-containing protein [Methylocaldum sp. GT1BB]|jgi:uncharacterized protein YuzE|uniref:DUF2283 domain-containing protein n=1 Tax=Methylocaldum sp. GT1BB TaxID=3438963 RepID=UPI003DA1B34D